ncbi:MAG TPA: DoxX family protein, partial [Candidatus Angelobacter sp.]
VAATGTALVAGGSSMLLGIKPKFGAAALLGFLTGVSPIMHDFWNMEEPARRQQEMINFMKNIALAGATVALMGVEEAWPGSVATQKPTKKLRKWSRRLAA